MNDIVFRGIYFLIKGEKIMNNVNYYNNEIGKCFNRIQYELSRPISDECRKKLNLVSSDILQMLKEYNNIQDYLNRILNTNYFFSSINDMNHFISSSMKKLNYDDIRITNLQSVVIPVRNIDERFCKARDYVDIIIRACNESVKNVSNNDINTNNNENMNYSKNINNENIYNNNQRQNNYYNMSVNNSNESKYGQSDSAYKIVYVLGIIMILIGVSIFGKYVYVNYLNNFIKGILLFGIGIAIILLSELLIKRKNVDYSKGVTIMGLCEIYISIMINAMGLHNISEFIAFVLVFLLSASTIVYSFVQKSFAFRYFAHGAGLLSFLFFADIVSKDMNSSLLVVGYIIILNILNVVLPIKNHNNYLSAFAIYTFVINCFIMVFLRLSLSSEVYAGVCMFYIILSFLIDKFILKQLESKDIANIFRDIFLIYVTVFSLFIGVNNKIIGSIIIGGGIIISIGCTILTKNMNKYKYLVPSVIFALKIVKNIEIGDSNIQDVLFYFVLNIGILLFGYLKVTKKSKLLNISMNISVIYMILISFINAVNIYCDIDAYFHLFQLFIGFITITGVMLCHIVNEEKNSPAFSVLKYYSLMLIVPTAIEINYLVNEYVTYIVICAVYFIAMIIYTRVEYLRNNNCKTDNVLIAFIIFIISIIILFRNMNVVTYIDIIGLIICFASLSIFTKDRYNNLFVSDLSKIGVINVVALTYLIIVFLKTFETSNYITIIIIDILLMTLACFDVIKGFLKGCNGIRAMGIVIALITCLKVPILDCIGMNAIEKTLVFIGIGIISMILAYVYSSYVKRNSNLK